MNILIKNGVFAFAGGIILLLPFFACAVGLDDALNYKSKPVIETSASVQAYTIQDIINKLPYTLNEKGVYEKDLGLDKDLRIVAFNKENFGECEPFYLYRFGSAAHGGFDSVLRFSFPENDERKENASRGIKHSLNYLKESGETNQGAKCAKREKYLVKIKEIFNAVIEAAPMVLQENQRLVAAKQAEQQQKQKEANNAAKIRQEAENKAKAEKEANELAEAKGRNERLESV